MATNILAKQDAYDEIKNFIIKNTSGMDYRSWYVGIADDPKRRLFTDHNVKKEVGPWIHRQCYSDTSAREVEQALIKNLKTQGGPGGGDDSTVFVYAYGIKNYTKE